MAIHDEVSKHAKFFQQRHRQLVRFINNDDHAVGVLASRTKQTPEGNSQSTLGRFRAGLVQFEKEMLQQCPAGTDLAALEKDKLVSLLEMVSQQVAEEGLATTGRSDQ